MIYKNGTNPGIEICKAALGLTGDVYVYDGNLRRRIASLESHKILMPDSKATTIEEAYAERVQYELAQERERAETYNDVETTDVECEDLTDERND